MIKKSRVAVLVLLAIVAFALAAAGVAANVAAGNAVDVPQVQISGKVTDEQGKPLRGVMVTAYDGDMERSVTVYSKADGSYVLANLPVDEYQVRVRQIGRADASKELGHVHQAASGVDLSMTKVSGLDLQAQRTGVDLLGLMKWEDEKDALNFKMMCAYCHQVGTLGFRSPEEPVDWEVMLTRMDGFPGLYEHTQKTLVQRIIDVYGREAEKNWPEFTPPEPPKGEALEAEVREWYMGKENDAMIHDLELGDDGLIYIVDMSNDAIETLDPATGERHVHSIPGGKAYDSFDPAIKGPHSIEKDAHGDMWVTLALSGQMAKFDTEKKVWEVVSGAPAPRERGGYPHTLRIDQKGVVWFTDAAGWVSSLDPSKYDAEAKRYEVKMYRLPNADQVRGAGARGESRGVTPYGIDIAPNGHVWYGKLNGQRLGRIIPELADDDPNKIVEWQPPVHGPRRFHVAPNGLIWVPGWASGDLASFDPNTEEWAVYPLPHGADSLPYALNVEPKTGHVWICGTGTDSMLRFDPEKGTFTEYLLPTRVTYTREVEFDDQGNVWVTNSNYPVRHVENGRGSVIRISTM